MGGVGTVLRWIFTNLLYPLLVLSVFLFIAAVIADFVLAVSGDRRIRRLVAAALPLTVVVFALVPMGGQEKGDSVQELLTFAMPWMRFAVGFVMGIIGLLLGRLLAKRDSEIGAAMYVLFLSGVASFMLYCLVAGVLDSLHIFLLGMVLGGGLYVVFRGAPSLRQRPTGGSSDSAT